jgi:DNA-binding NarL/FixJ family response regulator
MATVVIAADARTSRSIAAALVRAGHVVTASTATLAETLDIVRRRRPDVCVVDSGLRDGGLAAVAALADCGRRPRVVVVGRQSPAEARAARLAGATACATTEEIATAVSAVVNR